MEQQVHRPTLGALRFVLASMVMLSHVAPQPFHFLYAAVNGYVAVILFYVISGYLIGNALETFYVERVKEFLINRCLRIYPGYWIVLAATIAIILANGGDDIVGFGGAAAISGRDWKFVDLALASFRFDYIGVAWSLLVEMWFYVTIACVYAVFGRRGAYAACFAALGTYLLVTAFVDLIWWHPIAHIPYFVLGVALSRLWLGRDRLAASLLLLGCALFLVFIAFHHANPGKTHLKLFEPITVSFGPGSFNVIGLTSFLAVLVMALAINVRGRLRNIDNFLGDLSYPLFLCHYPLNATIGHFFAFLPDLQRVWLAIAVSLSASVLLWWAVDSRVVWLRDRIRGVTLYTLGPGTILHRSRV